MIGVALIMGFRTGASVGVWLAVAGILILFTLALTWLAVVAGLSAKTVDGASAFSYPLIFLPFISSAFVPTDSMPAPVAWFAENQPVTSIVDTIAGAVRRATRRQRHLGRPRLARRHPGRRLRLGGLHLPSQVQLTRHADDAARVPGGHGRHRCAVVGWRPAHGSTTSGWGCSELS